MFLSRLISGVRKLRGRPPEADFQGLHALEMLRRILERERARADRTGDHLSLLTFAPRCRADSRTTLVLVAKILRDRLRATDEVGWLDDQVIGVVLPNTAARGAWKLADDVCLDLPGAPPPICTVYSYPPTQLAIDDRPIRPLVDQDRS